MPFNEDGSRKAAYKKSGFKMKASKYGNNPMKKNFPSAFKDNGDDEAPSKVPTGKPGDRKQMHHLVDSIQKSIVPNTGRFDDHSEAHLKDAFGGSRSRARNLQNWVNKAAEREAEDIYYKQKRQDNILKEEGRLPKKK